MKVQVIHAIEEIILEILHNELCSDQDYLQHNLQEE